MPLRLLPVAGVVLALTAAPAQAATLESLERCYASTGRATEQREDVVVVGDAFTRYSTVEVLIDGVVVGSAPTGSVGEFRVLVDAPFQPRGERVFTLEARDGANSVITQSRVTNLAVFVRPKRAAPSRRVRFRGRGFMRSAPVFAHYLFGGREHKTVRLARRTAGPCGRFTARRRQIPIEQPRTGRWIIQIDQKRAYAPKPDPVWVRLPVDVVEVFR
jgi:hypothetical protein